MFLFIKPTTLENVTFDCIHWVSKFLLKRSAMTSWFLSSNDQHNALKRSRQICQTKILWWVQSRGRKIVISPEKVLSSFLNGRFFLLNNLHCGWSSEVTDSYCALNGRMSQNEKDFCILSIQTDIKPFPAKWNGYSSDKNGIGLVPLILRYLLFVSKYFRLNNMLTHLKCYQDGPALCF